MVAVAMIVDRRPEPHGIVKGDKIWGGMKRMKNNRKREEMMMMKHIGPEAEAIRRNMMNDHR